jgi:hypothetical protein
MLLLPRINCLKIRLLHDLISVKRSTFFFEKRRKEMCVYTHDCVQCCTCTHRVDLLCVHTQVTAGCVYTAYSAVDLILDLQLYL